MKMLIVARSNLIYDTRIIDSIIAAERNNFQVDVFCFSKDRYTNEELGLLDTVSIHYFDSIFSGRRLTRVLTILDWCIAVRAKLHSKKYDALYLHEISGALSYPF